jgi:hypothetical protein
MLVYSSFQSSTWNRQELSISAEARCSMACGMRSRSITILLTLLTLAGQEWICLTHEHCQHPACELQARIQTRASNRQCKCTRHRCVDRTAEIQPLDGGSGPTSVPEDSQPCCGQGAPFVAEFDRLQLTGMLCVSTAHPVPCAEDSRVNDRWTDVFRPSGTRLHLRLRVLLC